MKWTLLLVVTCCSGQWVERPRDVSQRLGLNATFNCSAGRRSGSVAWFKVDDATGLPSLLFVDDSKWEATTHMSAVPMPGGGYSLTLTSLRRSDDARYKCSIRESGGLNHTARLTVLGMSLSLSRLKLWRCLRLFIHLVILRRMCSLDVSWRPCQTNTNVMYRIAVADVSFHGIVPPGMGMPLTKLQFSRFFCRNLDGCPISAELVTAVPRQRTRIQQLISYPVLTLCVYLCGAYRSTTLKSTSLSFFGMFTVLLLLLQIKSTVSRTVEKRWNLRCCSLATLNDKTLLRSLLLNVWARSERCGISPTRFLTECRKMRLNRFLFFCFFVLFAFCVSCRSFCIVRMLNLSSVLYCPAWMALYSPNCAVPLLTRPAPRVTPP